MSACEKECSYPDTGDVLLCPCDGQCVRCHRVLERSYREAQADAQKLREALATSEGVRFNCEAELLEVQGTSQGLRVALAASREECARLRERADMANRHASAAWDVEAAQGRELAAARTKLGEAAACLTDILEWTAEGPLRLDAGDREKLGRLLASLEAPSPQGAAASQGKGTTT